MKKKADNLIKANKIIASSEQFYDEISKTETTVTLIKIEKENVEESKAEIELWNTPAVKGVSTMHTVVPANGRLYMRATSCFGPCCYKDGVFNPKCSGWQKTSLKVLRCRDEEYDTIKVTNGNDTDEEEEEEGEDEDDVPISELLALINNEKKEDDCNYGDDDDDDDDDGDDGDDDDEDDIPLSHFK